MCGPLSNRVRSHASRFISSGSLPAPSSSFVPLLNEKKSNTWSQSRESRCRVHSCCWAEPQSSPRWRSAGGVGSSWGRRWATDGRDSRRCWWCCGDRTRSGWCLPVSRCPSGSRCPALDPETSEYSSCRKRKHTLALKAPGEWRGKPRGGNGGASLPDEVGEALVEGPVVGRELRRGVGARPEAVDRFARPRQRSRIHVCCGLSEAERKVLLLTHVLIFKVRINKKN